MSTPINKPKKRPPSPKDDDDFYSVSQPAEPHAEPDLLERYMRATVQKRLTAAKKPPPPPRLPMLSGVLLFPFYLKTLGAWMAISFGLMVSAWLLMFWLGPGMILGMDSARLFGPPTCLAALLTFGYAASCCLIIIEETCHGWDSIEVSAGIDWKEWAWNFAHVTALVLQAALVGHLVWLACGAESWLPMVVGSLAALPLVLLGALAADGAWVPMAIVTIVLSLARNYWAWLFFYLETTAMILGWILLAAAGLGQEPWLVPLYAAPLLAAIMLIYARLAGRLAGCIAVGMLSHRTKGDHRDA
jgi:hypothetical protein